MTDLTVAQRYLLRHMAAMRGWVFAGRASVDAVAWSMTDLDVPLVCRGTRDGRATWELTEACRAEAER